MGGGAFSLALPLLVVVHLGLSTTHVEGAVSAAGVGYVMDLMTGGPKGLMTFLAVALYLFARLAGAGLDVQGRAGFSVLAALGTFLYGAAALGLSSLVTPAEASPGLPLLGRVGVEALLTGLVAALSHGLFQRVERLFHREDPGLLR